MNKLFSILLIVSLLPACNPYRRISGDMDRKPWERTIILNEAAREAPIKPPVIRPGDTTINDTDNKQYIKDLEESLQGIYLDYRSLTKLADSLYGGNVHLAALSEKLKHQADSIIKAVKNIPPIIKTAEKIIERESPQQAAQIALLTDGQAKLRRDLGLKDIEIDKLKADKDKAIEDRNDALKYKWYLYGVIALIIVYVGLKIWGKFKIW